MTTETRHLQTAMLCAARRASALSLSSRRIDSPEGEDSLLSTITASSSSLRGNKSPGRVVEQVLLLRGHRRDTERRCPGEGDQEGLWPAASAWAITSPRSRDHVDIEGLWPWIFNAARKEDERIRARPTCIPRFSSSPKRGRAGLRAARHTCNGAARDRRGRRCKRKAAYRKRRLRPCGLVARRARACLTTTSTSRPCGCRSRSSRVLAAAVAARGRTAPTLAQKKTPPARVLASCGRQHRARRRSAEVRGWNYELPDRKRALQHPRRAATAGEARARRRPPAGHVVARRTEQARTRGTLPPNTYVMRRATELDIENYGSERGGATSAPTTSSGATTLASTTAKAADRCVRRRP